MRKSAIQVQMAMKIFKLSTFTVSTSPYLNTRIRDSYSYVNQTRDVVEACITLDNSPSPCPRPPVFRWGYVNTEKLLYCFCKIILKNTRKCKTSHVFTYSIQYNNHNTSVYSRHKNNDKTKRIAGFHMTSLKFKLQKYWSSWNFTFMLYKSS